MFSYKACMSKADDRRKTFISGQFTKISQEKTTLVKHLNIIYTCQTELELHQKTNLTNKTYTKNKLINITKTQPRAYITSEGDNTSTTIDFTRIF